MNYQVNNTMYWKGCVVTGTLTHCSQKYRTIEPLWESFVASYKKQNTITT